MVSKVSPQRSLSCMFDSSHLNQMMVQSHASAEPLHAEDAVRTRKPAVLVQNWQNTGPSGLELVTPDLDMLLQLPV